MYTYVFLHNIINVIANYLWSWGIGKPSSVHVIWGVGVPVAIHLSETGWPGFRVWAMNLYNSLGGNAVISLNDKYILQKNQKYEFIQIKIQLIKLFTICFEFYSNGS